MDGTQNINLDAQTLESCLKTIYNFGSNTHQNICDGTSNTVMWGSLDWFGIIILMTIGLGMAIGVICIIVMAIIAFWAE